MKDGKSEPPSVPLTMRAAASEAEMIAGARACFERLSTRRSVRSFSPDPVPREAIEWAIRAAGSAPSGANKQPWTFVAVSDPATKSAIRQAAEEEERAFYGGRAGEEWLADLAPFGTDAEKPFLEIAPWLIVCFQQNYAVDPETGERRKHYYVPESASLACANLLAALHEAGLATLTHTPSPMGFLRHTLRRPAHERAIMIIVTGKPAADARAPDIRRKSLEEIAVFV